MLKHALCIHTNRLAGQVEEQSPGEWQEDTGGCAMFTVVCPDPVITDPI